MVFIYTMAAMAARAVHMTIRKQHVFARFYTRFSFISLPALIMFWIGVWYRISEYGFTQARVYLVVCGVIMTATMVLFFSEKYGRFLYANIIAIVLLALFTYVPGISAAEIEQRSQAGRTADHPANAADTVYAEKATFLYWYSNELQAENIPVDITGFCSLHKIGWSDSGYGDGLYRYNTSPAASGYAQTRLIVVSPSNDTLANRSFAEILSAQFEKCGLDFGMYLRERDEDEILPWDYLDMGVTKEFLLRERRKAYLAQCTPGCNKACSACGLQKEGLCRVNR